MSIELAFRDLPHLHTAPQCRIGAVVLLQRTAGRAAAEPVSGTHVIETLLREKPFYGEVVWARHENAVRRLADIPAYLLTYDSLEEAMDLLCALVQKQL